MTDLTTIEDILESIFGLVLGNKPGQYTLAPTKAGGQVTGGTTGSQINDGFRPRTIKGPGFWLITLKDQYWVRSGWTPEYDKEAVTFYRWKEGGGPKLLTRLTVWVGL